MAAALNSVLVACLLALVISIRAARPLDTVDEVRPCHTNNGWSYTLCRDVCRASGFEDHAYMAPNMADGTEARCCCCPKGYPCVAS